MLASIRRVSATAFAALVLSVLAVPALSSPATAVTPAAEPGCRRRCPRRGDQLRGRAHRRPPHLPLLVEERRSPVTKPGAVLTTCTAGVVLPPGADGRVDARGDGPGRRQRRVPGRLDAGAGDVLRRRALDDHGAVLGRRSRSGGRRRRQHLHQRRRDLGASAPSSPRPSTWTPRPVDFGFENTTLADDGVDNGTPGTTTRRTTTDASRRWSPSRPSAASRRPGSGGWSSTARAVRSSWCTGPSR